MGLAETHTIVIRFGIRFMRTSHGKLLESSFPPAFLDPHPGLFPLAQSN
jgi:hypothetical protein